MNERAFNSVFDTDSFEWWSDIRLFPEAGLLPRLLAGQKTCLYVLWVQISVAMAKKAIFIDVLSLGQNGWGWWRL